MNINSDNFSEYIDVAIKLTEEKCYTEACRIALEVYYQMQTWNDASLNSQLNDTIKIITFCQWRGAEIYDELALLSDSLKTDAFWDHEFIENLTPAMQAWVFRQRALAYLHLNDRWAKGKLKTVYTDYAMEDMTRAIDTMEELVETNPEFDDDLQQSKLEMVMILQDKSMKHARDYTMLLAGEITDLGKFEVLKGLYEQCTDALFNDLFRYRPMDVLFNMEDIDEQVINDIAIDLLDEIERDDDPYWWAFTHHVKPEDRKKIMIVETFSDARDNDFADIPWVFTIDRLPGDINFGQDSPQPGVVYTIDRYELERYNPLKN